MLVTKAAVSRLTTPRNWWAAIVAYAAKAAGVPESSIALAMEALFDAMNFFVLNGHSVQIPNLGTFYLCVSVKSSASEAEFTANFAQNLRRVSIRFLPDPELKAMIASTAINTLVDDGGYISEGIISVTSALFGQGSTLVPMNQAVPMHSTALPAWCSTAPALPRTISVPRLYWWW